MSQGDYKPAWWIPGPHVQTIWGKLARRVPPAPTRSEIWTTPDGDTLEIHRIQAGNEAPHLLLLHGLEGTVRSHYAQALLWQAAMRGWNADLMMFRSCGTPASTAPRLYHSGETGDLAWVVDRILSENPAARLGIIGVSLGGNVLLKYLGEKRERIPAQLRGAAAISVPFDLELSSRQIDSGFSRIYQAHFLRTLRRKARTKLAQFPALADRVRMESARTMFEYDDAVTAPVHGFAGAHDYYTRSSSLGWLDQIRIPTLLLSAVDDPFLPAQVLDDVRKKAAHNPLLTVEFHDRGGHVGFIAGRNPFRPVYYAEQRAAEFISELVT